MIIVTGTAARCGTSAMMRALLDDGYKPHSYSEKFPEYVAPEKNPEGFWDVKKEYLFSSDPIPTEDAVIKLWGPQFHRVEVDDIEAVIVMHRSDIAAQAKSIRSCAIAEGLGDLSPVQVAEMFRIQQDGLTKIFSETPQIRVNMDSLRADPQAVISNIKEIVQWQQ